MLSEFKKRMSYDICLQHVTILAHKYLAKWLVDGHYTAVYAAYNPLLENEETNLIFAATNFHHSILVKQNHAS